MTKRTCHHTTQEHARDRAVPLVAGFDSINYSSRARISSEMRAKLEDEKLAAQLAAREGAARCPE